MPEHLGRDRIIQLKLLEEFYGDDQIGSGLSRVMYCRLVRFRCRRHRASDRRQDLPRALTWRSFMTGHVPCSERRLVRWRRWRLDCLGLEPLWRWLKIRCHRQRPWDAYRRILREHRLLISNVPAVSLTAVIGVERITVYVQLFNSSQAASAWDFVAYLSLSRPVLLLLQLQSPIPLHSLFVNSGPDLKSYYNSAFRSLE